MEGALLLDVIIGEGTTILELLSSEDETLLVGWDTLLILNLGLDVIDGVRGFDLEGNSLTRQGLDEDLHSTTKTEHWWGKGVVGRHGQDSNLDVKGG